MKKVIVIANCQGGVINSALDEKFHGGNFQLDYLAPVHTIEKKYFSEVERKINSADIVITQPILDGDRFGPMATVSVKDSSADVIVIPSIYYSGYFPTFGTISGFESGLNFVHDFLIMGCFLKGYSVKECCDFLLDNTSLESAFIRHLNFSSLADLEARENSNAVDVTLSAFIKENYQSQRLFYQFNHPCDEVFQFLMNGISKIIGQKETKHNFNKVRLDEIWAPVYPFVRSSLGLEWDGVFAINKKEVINLTNLITMYYSSYKLKDRGWLISQMEMNKNYILTKKVV